MVVGTAHYIIRPFVGKKIQFKELRYLFLPKEGQLAARDFNSASNIEAQLEDHPDEELLIVVLGKDHVEGVSRELVNLGPYSRIQSLKPIH
ncbi:MAG: hypothetical protein HYW85_06550 [Deltaproteobacteria bacterium]|nr:hypothetical protein [Deltaproteobacteria bacterium]